MRMYWTDLNGAKWPVVKLGKPLYPGKNPAHAALRAMVYRRDGFMCRRCGQKAHDIPTVYDGKSNLYVARMSGPKIILGYLVLDHIVPRKQGGQSHPANLQTLCDGCNTVKRDRTYEYRNRNTASYLEQALKRPR
jgi:5-methylcytosine-specific restriction endonuclease McrA